MGLGSRAKILINDVSAEAMQRFSTEAAALGPIEVVSNGADAARRANVVLTMLPNGAAVESVYLHPQSGILAGIHDKSTHQPGAKTMIVECGTIETATIDRIAQETSRLQEKLPSGHSVVFLDAPVSGGPMGAQAGSLTFMVGGETEDFDQLKPILSHMRNADGIYPCSAVGAGTASSNLAACEALNIGAKKGLDLKMLTSVINASGGQCWVTSKSNPVPGIQPNTPASRGYEGGFRIELCRKVLAMGSDLAKEVGARTILDKPTLGALDECASHPDCSGKDARVLYKWLNQME
ncbi:putative 3-hydroxyisobutyrate dehydrogenase [Penicillium rolfsii]|nr:putative 3-hydroxyisobutyrate dehydrogenase [Penicillium rolfsii]